MVRRQGPIHRGRREQERCEQVSITSSRNAGTRVCLNMHSLGRTPPWHGQRYKALTIVSSAAPSKSNACSNEGRK